MLLRLLIAIVFALAILVALTPQQVHACSCVPLGPPADELARASAVFSGKVIDRQRVSLTLDLPTSEQAILTPEQVTLKVSQVWKGPAFQTLVVYSGICGYELQVDQEYLVYAYAHGEEDLLFVTHCSRTQPLAEAAEDLSALGEGITPISPPVSPLSPLSPLRAGGNSSPPTCMLPVALVGILGMLPISARMRVAMQRIPNK